MPLDLSIIICTHNRYEVLPGALSSVEAQTLARNQFELLLVDNSTDIEAQNAFLARLHIRCEHRVMVEQLPGLSRARNIGVRAARGRVVAFMDDDARATPDWAREILQTFERRPKAAVAGGPVEPIWPAPRPLWLHKWHEGYLTVVDRGDAERALAREEWLAGTNIAFLREPLMRAGMFDERLGRTGRMLLSNEELQVTQALRDEGHEIVYSPNAVIRHIVHADRLNPDWMRRRIFWQTVSNICARDGGAPRPFAESLQTILDYQQRHMRAKRGIADLFEDTNDPEQFFQQLEALASLTELMAADGRDMRVFLRDPEPL